MDQHSALENDYTERFSACRNRKEQRNFVRSLSKSERKFLKGQLEYKQIMRSLAMQQMQEMAEIDE